MYNYPQILQLWNYPKVIEFNVEVQAYLNMALLFEFQYMKYFGGTRILDTKFSITCSNFIELAVPSFLNQLNNKLYLYNLVLASCYSRFQHQQIIKFQQLIKQMYMNIIISESKQYYYLFTITLREFRFPKQPFSSQKLQKMVFK
ncbi:Hypothetical_protein [Hexamita inflata]|uniref:Hypothetical_protein n=1 Tax=Hexamita inflata TaxID=28002 RepID=A0AA86RBA7_9EUKA|nr:Hypothetical protein HINF_LOCUS62481 [Hexamita inflata]